MKKVSIVFILALFSLVSFKAEAVQCSGSTFYHTTLAEALAATRDAKLNCCAGSTITTINLATGQQGLISVHEDGIFSSCFEG